MGLGLTLNLTFLHFTFALFFAKTFSFKEKKRNNKAVNCYNIHQISLLYQRNYLNQFLESHLKRLWQEIPLYSAFYQFTCLFSGFHCNDSYLGNFKTRKDHKGYSYKVSWGLTSLLNLSLLCFHDNGSTFKHIPIDSEFLLSYQLT